MTDHAQDAAKQVWVEPKANPIWVDPEIRELSVRETFALPNLGADVGGNIFPDCQRS